MPDVVVALKNRKRNDIANHVYQTIKFRLKSLRLNSLRLRSMTPVINYLIKWDRITA